MLIFFQYDFFCFGWTNECFFKYMKRQTDPMTISSTKRRKLPLNAGLPATLCQTLKSFVQKCKNLIFSWNQYETSYLCIYSNLSNKCAGWNKTCRLENSANFGNFGDLKLCKMDLNHILVQIGSKLTDLRVIHSN